MNRWQILNAESENYSPRAVEILRGLGEVHLAQLDRARLLASLAEIDVLIVRLATQIDEEVFAAAPNLKAVVSATTGLDHIDLAAAERHGVKVLSLRGETNFLRSIPATAELTWALLLALTRNIPAAFSSVLQGEWDRDEFKGHDLSGRRLGILGVGRVGSMVARYGMAFGMHVAAYDPAPLAWVDGVQACASMAELLQTADVLTIHVPLVPETVGLVGQEELAQISEGGLLINTSRGDVLDETALVQALANGHLAGAALDVMRHERSDELQYSALIRYARTHANLLITPHIGGATYESMAATEIFMAEKLVSYAHSLNL